MVENKTFFIFFKHKLITLFALLILMALSAETIEYIKGIEGVYPNFFEILLIQANEPQMILFPLMYVLLLFSIDSGEINGINEPPIRLLKYVFVTSSQFMIIFILANLFYCLMFLNINTVFNIVWSYVGMLSNIKLSPLVATVVSLVFLFMRFSFMLYLIKFINVLTQKSHWGFWSAIIVSFIDYIFYELLDIQYPLGILPIEHTRIIYTSAVVPDFENIAIRIPYFTSVLYWLGLIAAVYIALVFVYKRRRNNEKNLH